MKYLIITLLSLSLVSCKTTEKKPIKLLGAVDYCKEYPDDEYCQE